MIRLILFLLAHCALISLLCVCSYVVGRRLTSRIGYASVSEEISFSTGLGLGTHAYLILTLGALDLLYPSVTIAALLGLQLLSYSVWVNLRLQLISFFKNGSNLKRTGMVTAIVLALLLPLTLWALFPPTAFDSIMYHLPYAKIYLQHHGLVFTPFLRYPVSPQTNEMLFALMLLLGSDLGAQLVQLLMTVLTALAIFCWGQQLFSFRTGLWAASLWLGTPLVLWLGCSAYVDAGLTLFVTLGALAMFNWLSGKSDAWLVLAAVFAGLAAGSKYSALFILGVFGLVVLYRTIRTRRPAYFLLFSAIACAVASPWYLRNFYLTGNPVFPFFPSLFGYGLWSADDLEFQFLDWVKDGVRGRSSNFYRDALALGFPLLLGLPMALFAGIRDSRIRNLLIFAAAYFLFWLFGASLPRYLLPVWPLLTLATAASLESFATRWFSLRGLLEQTRSAVLIALLLVFPGWLYAAGKVYRRWPLPHSDPGRHGYLTNQLTTYPAYRFLNESKGMNYRLYALYDTNMAYYADGTFMGDWFGPARYKDVVDSMKDGGTLFARLKGLGVDYFLVSTDNYPVTLPNDDEFRNHFKLIYSTPHVMLFELQ